MNNYFAGADPYCIVSCEREKVRTKTVQDTVNPEYGQKAIFYRKNPGKNPIKIQVTFLVKSDFKRNIHQCLSICESICVFLSVCPPIHASFLSI